MSHPPRRLISTALMAWALALVIALALPSTAFAAVPPPPQPPQPLPTAVDVHNPSYEAQTTCDLTTKPGVAAFAKLMTEHYDRRDYHTVRTCLSDESQHYDGRAMDWMLSAYDSDDRAIADAVATWLTKPVNGVYGANARRFGIMFLIWNRKVWKAYRNPETWTTYTGSHPHDDHIHVSFYWDGACKRTSWWTGVALKTWSANKCSTGTGPLVTVDTEFTKHKDTVLKLGSTGDAVRLAQTNLPGVSVVGEFGPQTRTAVIAFQEKWKLDVSGRVNLGVWNQMERLHYPLIKYRTTTVLRKGMSGQAVKDAQRALRITQDGAFGSGTEAAVKRIQGKYRLAQTGVIRALTWAALDEELRSRARQARADADSARSEGVVAVTG